jgi:hypothetical protein
LDYPVKRSDGWEFFYNWTLSFHFVYETCTK